MIESVQTKREQEVESLYKDNSMRSENSGRKKINKRHHKKNLDKYWKEELELMSDEFLEHL